MINKSKITSDENLGRGVFSKRHARKARRGEIPLRVFLESAGNNLLSVDRLDCVSSQEILSIAEKIADSRSQASLKTRSFYGWAVITVDKAASKGRQVKPSPQPGNPYHADIVLPDVVCEDRDEQIRHAQELADESLWRDRE